LRRFNLWQVAHVHTDTEADALALWGVQRFVIHDGVCLNWHHWWCSSGLLCALECVSCSFTSGFYALHRSVQSRSRARP
jgi:hypothetical protein